MLSSFYAWLSLLDHYPDRSHYFWNSLTPRFLDVHRRHSLNLEDYPAILAWDYFWDFDPVTGDWIPSDIPF
jgi:hypothetical protein